MLDELLSTRRVVVCVGSGGVGKTTLSASLGLRAAMLGRKTLVLTIDPARRLADSLGLPMEGNVQTRIGPELLSAAGLEPKGELWAMTLDLSRTWDDLVARYAASPENRDRILQNRLYQLVSTQLAGSLEYMAMEKVYELESAGDYDLIVLDTPPTAHALDFLDAPNRLLDMLGTDAAKWLVGPAMAAGKVGLSIVQFGSQYVLRTLAKFTGVEMLQQMAEFFAAFTGMYEGFKERAAATKALLAGPKSGFVLVTGPSPRTVDEAVFFAEELGRSGIAVSSAVINRVHGDPLATGGAHEASEIALALARARVPNGGEPHLSERLERTVGDLSLVARRDRAQIEHFRERTAAAFPIFGVPRMERDVHDVSGLWAVNGLIAPV